jgi:ribosome-binding protein aMBF1 (putative translation factor)
MSAERMDWISPRDDRMREAGAHEVYQAARLAFDLGRAVREIRQRRGWSQAELARASGMTQSAVARFEAGGAVPTLPVLDRLAAALDADLVVRVEPRSGVG